MVVVGFFLAGLILSRLVLRASQDETHGVRCDSSSKRPFWGHDQMPGFLVICFSSGWSQPQGSLQCVTSEISTPLLPPPPPRGSFCCVPRTGDFVVWPGSGHLGEQYGEPGSLVFLSGLFCAVLPGASSSLCGSALGPRVHVTYLCGKKAKGAYE